MSRAVVENLPKTEFFAGEDNDFVSFVLQVCAHVVRERGEGFMVGLLSSGLMSRAVVGNLVPTIVWGIG